MVSNDGHASRVARLRLRALVGGQGGGARDGGCDGVRDCSCDGGRDGSRDGGDDKKLDSEASEFGEAIGIVADDVAWVLVTGRHERSLGPALMWALRNNAKALKLFSDEKTGDLARIAAHFDFAIEIFAVDESGVARLASPASVERLEVSVDDEMFVEFIKSAGAEVVREHGVVAGEVCGLEVCRVVHGVGNNASAVDGAVGAVGADTAGEFGEAGESELEIGVGAHDRETFKLLHGKTATTESLRKVIVEVAARRAVGAQVHPLNQLARERMLRHYVCQSPQLVGAKSLQLAQPPRVRTNMKDTVPCCAVGVSMNGEKMVVIFSVGVDPDVVSYGADARGQINGAAELVFAMPTRDIVPAVERVAQLLRRPARFVGVDVISNRLTP